MKKIVLLNGIKMFIGTFTGVLSEYQIAHKLDIPDVGNLQLGYGWVIGL